MFDARAAWSQCVNGTGATAVKAPHLGDPQTVVDTAARDADAMSLARAAAGDDAAFAKLYQTHRRRVFRLAYAMVLDEEEAREITQDVFVALHRVAPRWQPNARVGTWLQRTTFRVASGWRRKLRRWSTATLTVAPHPSPETTTDMAERWALALQALATLPARQRGVVQLHLRESMSPAEIATAVGITSNAARVSLHKGLARMRAAMKNQDEGNRP